MNVTEKWTFVLGKVQNIVGKGEKCWLPKFASFPTIFLKGFFFKDFKSQSCVLKSSPFPLRAISPFPPQCFLLVWRTYCHFHGI